MISKFALAMLTVLAIGVPVQEAAAQESTLGGALFGGRKHTVIGSGEHE